MNALSDKKWIVGLAAVVVALLVPSLVSNSYHMLLVDMVAVYAIAVLGLNYITGLVGQTFLGMAGIFGIGAYTSTLLSVKLNVNPYLCLIAAAIMGVVLGFLLGYPSLRLQGFYFGLTTLGFGEIVKLLLNNMTDLTNGANGVRSIPGLPWPGMDKPNYFTMYYPIVVLLILGILLATRITRSRWGRSFKAIRDNVTSVESCGMNIARTKITAFILCCVYGSVAGALYSSIVGYINPVDFNAELSTRFLMMLMMGGIGSVPGCILGTAIVVVLPETLKFMEGYYWLVFSSVLLVMIMLRPYGLASIGQDIVRRFRAFRARRSGVTS